MSNSTNVTSNNSSNNFQISSKNIGNKTSPFVDDLFKKCFNKIINNEYSKSEQYLNLISLQDEISLQQKTLFYSYKFTLIYTIV